MRSISNFDDSGNIILRNRQLNFNNLVAVVTDSRVQEDTLILVYYSEATQSIAQAANINVQTNSGNITFTAANQPTGTIVCDIVLLSANIVNQVAKASDIDYNNTASGLTATDVQGAVDELAESYPADKVMMPDGVTSVEDVLGKIVVNSCTLTYYDANTLRGVATVPDGFSIEDAFISIPRYDTYTVKGRLFTFVKAGNLIVFIGNNFVSGDTVTVNVAWIKA